MLNVEFIKCLSKQVHQKIYAIKNIFFLPLATKLQFFKSLRLPHFDYCCSIFLFFSPFCINKVTHFYNSCISNLFKIDLKNLSITEQDNQLKPLNLFSFSSRLLYRFSIFSFKILNQRILKDFISNIFYNTSTHQTRLIYFL